MKKITVCLLNDSFPPIIDGVSNAVLNYASNIQQHWGHALVVTPSYPGFKKDHWTFPVCRYPSIDVRKMTSGYVAGIPFSPELSTMVNRQRIDIIHSHCPMTSAILGRVIQKRVNAPMIMTYHTKYDIDIANVLRNKALQQSTIKSMITNINAYDEVWTVSKGAGENLRSLGFQGDYIIMPNGVDIPRQQAEPSAVEQVTAGYDLPAGVPVYLYVGRLMWYKGLRISLDALQMLRKQGKDFRMVIIGGGGDREAIQEYVQTAGLSDRVFFTGVVADRDTLRAWYTRADLFLFPSTFDSNGLVVREAAACDLASVLVKGSCAAEDVTDGRNAFLIEENASSMAQKLMQVSSDLEHLRQVGVNAGDDLYLSWENAVIQAVERYHVVMDLYRSGAYKEHDTISDNLYATQGDLMYTAMKVGQVFSQGKQFAQALFTPKDGARKKQKAIKTNKKARKIKQKLQDE